MVFPILLFLYLASLVNSLNIYIDNCTSIQQEGTCQSPFCSISNAFSKNFNENYVTFIIISQNLTILGQSEQVLIFFQNFTYKTISIRPPILGECNITWNFSNIRIDFMGNPIKFMISNNFSMQNVLIDGSKLYISNITTDISSLFQISDNNGSDIYISIQNSIFTNLNQTLFLSNTIKSAYFSIKNSSFFNISQIISTNSLYWLYIEASVFSNFSQNQKNLVFFNVLNIYYFSLKYCNFTNISSLSPFFQALNLNTFLIESCNFNHLIDLYEILDVKITNLIIISSKFSNYSSKTSNIFINLGINSSITLENCSFDNFASKKLNFLAISLETTVSLKNVKFQYISIFSIFQLNYNFDQIITLTNLFLTNISFSSMISVFEFQNVQNLSLTCQDLTIKYAKMSSFIMPQLIKSSITMKNCTFSDIKMTYLYFLDDYSSIVMNLCHFEKISLDILTNYFVYIGSNSIIYINRLLYKNGYVNNSSTQNDIRLFKLQDSNNFTIINSIFSSPGQFLGFYTCNYNNNINVSYSLFKSFKNDNLLNDSREVTYIKFGGVFYIEQFNNFTCTYCYFFENKVNINQNLNGGVIHIEYINKVKVLNSIFIHNTAGYKGGIFNVYSLSTIKFDNNTVAGSTSLLGGFAALAFDNTFHLTNSNFFQLKAENHASAFFCVESNLINMINVSYFELHSMGNAGFVYFSINNYLYGKFVVINGTITGLAGGILYGISENGIYFNYSYFINCHSVLEGGGFYLASGNTLFISNSNISDVASKHILGAINLNCNNTLKINRTLITLSDGILMKWNSAIYIEDSNINDNSKKPLLTIEQEDSGEQPVIFYINCEQGNIFMKDMLIKKLSRGLLFSRQCNINEFINITMLDNTISPTTGFITLGSQSFFNGSYLHVKYNNFLLFSISNSSLHLTRFIYISKGYLVISSVKSQIKISHSSFRHPHSFSYYFITNPYESFDILDKKDGFIYITGGTISLINNEFIGGFGKRGAAIVIEDYVNVYISKTLCGFNQALTTGGCIELYIDDMNSLNCNYVNNEVTVKRSVFINNKASIGGSIYTKYSICYRDKVQFNHSIRIKRNKFSLNKANLGGAMYFWNVSDSLKISHVSFDYNQALDTNDTYSKGGGVFFGCQNYCLPKKRISKAIFYNNKASIGAGVYMEVDPMNDFKETIFSKNQYKFYGDSIATIPKTIIFYNSINFTQKFLLIQNLMSGMSYDSLFCIIGEDYLGHETFQNDDIIENIIINEISNYNSTLLIRSFGDGLLCGSSTLVSKPKPNAEFIYNISHKAKDSNFGSWLILKLEFRPCDLGERQTDDFRCEVCPIGQYSFEKNTSEKCKPCLEEDNFYCLGSSHLSPKPGYWRLNNSSNNFIRCPNPSTCLGYYEEKTELFDMTKASGQCHTGYKGVLCAECEEGYGITPGNFCTECASILYYFYLVGFFLIRVGLLIYSLHRGVTMCASSAAGFLKTEEVISSTIIKILLNHMQVLNIIISFPFEWNRTMFNIVMVGTGINPNISESYSWSCLFHSVGINISTHYLKIINLWLSCLFLLGICYGYYRYYLTRKIKFYLKFIKKTEEDILESTYFIILFICYADFVTVAFETFGCRNVGYEGFEEYRLVKDYSIRCWEDSHEGWGYGLVVPYLVIFALGFPVMILLNMIYLYKKKGLNNKDSIIRYGFFYLSYENEYFYWDFVILTRKLILSIINTYIVAVYQSIFSISVMLMFFILLVFLYLQVHCNPYLRKRLKSVNILEKISLISLSGTMFLAILSMQNMVDFITRTFLLALSLCLNLIFIAYWGNIYYKSDIKKTLRRFLHLAYMVLLYLWNKLKGFCERRPIHSVKFERRVGLTGIQGNFFRKKLGILNLESNENDEEEKKQGIKKRLLGNISLAEIDFEHFALERATRNKSMKSSMSMKSTMAPLSFVNRQSAQLDFVTPLKSPVNFNFLKEDSPLTKSFKDQDKKKLIKGRTFADESENIEMENKILKFKLDRSNKEVQDLKHEIRISQEMTNYITKGHFSSKEKTEENEEISDFFKNNQLFLSNYYIIFLGKMVEAMNSQESFKSLIENQGFLLKTREIEISYKCDLLTEKGGFLKYYIDVVNLKDEMLENVWIVFKQAEMIKSIFPDISCLNMVADQTFNQEITISLKNLFIIPLIFDLSYSVRGNQYVFSMVLPNTLWKLIHPLSQSLTDFLVAWKNPFLLKLKSKKTPLTSYIYMKKSLLIEKIFSNFLLDLKPDEDFEDDLIDKNCKKFGLMLKNRINEQTYMIVFKFSNKNFNIEAKVDELSDLKEKIIVEFIMATLNSALCENESE